MDDISLVTESECLQQLTKDAGHLFGRQLYVVTIEEAAQVVGRELIGQEVLAYNLQQRKMIPMLLTNT